MEVYRQHVQASPKGKRAGATCKKNPHEHQLLHLVLARRRRRANPLKQSLVLEAADDTQVPLLLKQHCELILKVKNQDPPKVYTHTHGGEELSLPPGTPGWCLLSRSPLCPPLESPHVRNWCRGVSWHRWRRNHKDQTSQSAMSHRCWCCSWGCSPFLCLTGAGRG